MGYPETNGEYILDTDASAHAIGGVLSQKQREQERVIAYYSKTVSTPERSYCVTRRELLAVVKSIKHFHPYLYGKNFKLRTDHASLRWLCRRTEPFDQVARWLELLAEFKYTIEHRPGPKHGNADGLSCQRCADCKQCQPIEKRDRGLSMEESEKEEEQVMSPTRRDFCSCSWQTDGELNHAELLWRSRLEPEQVETKWIQADVMSLTNFNRLKHDQQFGSGAVAQMYKVLKSWSELSYESLQEASSELKQLYSMKDSMRVDQDGILEVNYAENRRDRWRVICPEGTRKTMIWQTHLMAHSGANRTVSRIKLTWYWPGMVP